MSISLDGVMLCGRLVRSRKVGPSPPPSTCRAAWSEPGCVGCAGPAPTGPAPLSLNPLACSSSFGDRDGAKEDKGRGSRGGEAVGRPLGEHTAPGRRQPQAQLA